MKINLDLQLSTNLRSKIHGPFHYRYGIQHSFVYPSKKKGQHIKEISAYDCICSAVDRIQEITKHCNSLDLSDDKFAFYDFLNYSQTLIECITILGRIFGVQYSNPSIKESCFSAVRETGKGNDEKYFKYLRSLCAIHPVQTNNHPDYQGEEPEWCPYITSGQSAFFYAFRPIYKDADFIAVVYRNDMEFSKHIPIYIEELFAYVERRYAFLNEVAAAAERYYQNLITELRNRHIPTPNECENYLTYLNEMETAMQERCGEAYAVREWSAIMQTHYDDNVMQNLLSRYQHDLKVCIQTVHNRLQKLDYGDSDFTDFEMLHYDIGRIFKKYGYETEKLHYLYPCNEMEDFDCNVLDFVNAQVDFDQERMTRMLSVMDNAIRQNATHEELRDLAKEMDREFRISNSEWARLQLKIIEFAYSKIIKFDYLQNNWHLYLQIQIANWILKKQIRSREN